MEKLTEETVIETMHQLDFLFYLGFFQLDFAGLKPVAKIIGIPIAQNMERQVHHLLSKKWF